MKPAHNTSCFEMITIISLCSWKNKLRTEIITCFDLKVETFPFKGKKKVEILIFISLPKNVSCKEEHLRNYSF